MHILSPSFSAFKTFIKDIFIKPISFDRSHVSLNQPDVLN